MGIRLRACYNTTFSASSMPLILVFNRQFFITCSIWKPLRGPLQDWPLAVCDASSVGEDDLVVADQVYPKHVTENIQVQHGPGQKWYYLSNQQPDELLLFRQTDSKLEKLRGGGESSKLTVFCAESIRMSTFLIS